MHDAMKKGKEKEKELLRKIVEHVATFPGVTITDAFTLGQLVHEYGVAVSGNAVGGMMLPILDALAKPPVPRRDELDAWQGGGL